VDDRARICSISRVWWLLRDIMSILLDTIIKAFHQIESRGERVVVVYMTKKAIDLIVKECAEINEAVSIYGVKIIIGKIPYSASFFCVGMSGSGIIGSI